MNYHSQIPSTKLSTRLLIDLSVVRKRLQEIENSFSPTIDKLEPMRKIDQQLSLRLLHFLSAELRVELSLPNSFPLGEEEEEQEEPQQEEIEEPF